MDSKDFIECGQSALDFIVNYHETIRERDVLPSVEPGYLQHMVPQEMPLEGENWKDILQDMDRVILPGVTGWQSPHFHAYYPSSTSYPSIIGELLSAALGTVGFSWITSPACTELEVVTMDWLGKAIGLPEKFLSCSEGPGGGVIQGSASESTFICLLAAKQRMLRKVLKEHPEWDEGVIKGKMVAYTSDQSNSSVEKAGLLGSMKMRLLETDKTGRLTGAALHNAIQQDLSNGLIPTYVCATLGTTPTCAFDCLEEIGPICREFGLWFHVDAAYAGSACVCPEFRYMLRGVEVADSFNFNPHKWLLVNFDCSALWVEDSGWLIDAFNVDRIYLKHHKEGLSCAPDYRHWQIPLGRRFRALKLWITLRAYGVSGLQAHIRNHVALAKEFEDLVLNDPNFEVVTERSLGLVCFRLKGPAQLSRSLLDRVTARKKIYLVAGEMHGEYCLRFVVCSPSIQSQDVMFAWRELQSQAEVVLSNGDNMAGVVISEVDNKSGSDSSLNEL